MAHSIQWVVPSRVLEIKLWDDVDMSEMTALVHETHTFVNMGQAPVHILINSTMFMNRPVNFQEINQIAKTMSNPGTGWWVIVNAGKMMWFTASVLSKLLGIKLKSANGTEEALAILKRVDFTLDTLPSPQAIQSAAGTSLPLNDTAL
ncbi:MAG: hypothetical protein LCI00_29335 [Chloroflexi bacterium]|nr:hypothetical protein [Chloroflexota bacterium]MCC6893695.1 hypothetical protein [Anaerolineae bacterium]